MTAETNGVRRITAFVSASIAYGFTLIVLGVCLAVAAAWFWPEGIVPQAEQTEGRFELLLFYTRVFQFHLGCVAAAASLVVLLFATGWKRSLFCAVATAGLLLPFAREYVPKQPPKVATKTLRVMSMNLFFMNFDAGRILAAIERENPDVIVACEVTRWSEDAVFRPLAQRYPYSIHPDFDNGAFVISRVPFTNPRGAPEIRRPLLFEIEGQPFALYAVHLTSPGNRTHLMRNRVQTEALAQIVAAELRPMMVVGDCNFTQMTAEYARLCAAGLRSTHDLIGFGLGNTWGPKWYPRLYQLPGVRIDQMLMSRELTATSHHVGDDTGSDHRPIVADVGFAR